MSGDQNQNQNQQKQKGGNQNGPKEGITIATSVNPSQSGTLGPAGSGCHCHRHWWCHRCVGLRRCAERIRLDCWQVDWSQCSPRLQRDSHRPHHGWLRATSCRNCTLLRETILMKRSVPSSLWPNVSVCRSASLSLLP